MSSFKFSSFILGLCAVSSSVLANPCVHAEIDVHNLTTVALELVERDIEGMPEASTIAPGTIIKPGEMKPAYFNIDENKGMPIKGNVTFLGKLSDHGYVPGAFVKMKYKFFEDGYEKVCGRSTDTVSLNSNKFNAFVVPHYNGVTHVYVTD